MPLDSTKAITKTEAINAAFLAIGTAGDSDTAMPRERGAKIPTEPIAWEVLASKHLRKAAEARYERAVKAAIKAGVIFDHKKAPLPDGTSKVVYKGTIVRIDLAVTTGRAGLDIEGFVEGVIKAGLKPALVTRLLAKHATTTAAPHEFTPSLVTT